MVVGPLSVVIISGYPGLTNASSARSSRNDGRGFRFFVSLPHDLPIFAFPITIALILVPIFVDFGISPAFLGIQLESLLPRSVCLRLEVVALMPHYFILKLLVLVADLRQGHDLLLLVLH